MGGDLARLGFRFQDFYLLRRILLTHAESYGQVPPHGGSAIRFGIEGKLDVSGEVSPDAPAWDVIVQLRTEFEVIEVKSGTLPKQERITFWKRIRKEHACCPTDRSLIPVIVVDPDRVNGLDRWQQLASLAATYDENETTSEPPDRVLDADDLLQEALWWLSEVQDSGNQLDQAVPRSTALRLIAHLRVELWVMNELESTVLESIGLLFSDGITEQVRDLFLGWLAGRAVIRDQQRRFFTIAELLEEMEVRQFCASLSPGTLAKWRNLWAELPGMFNTRVRTRLGIHGAVVTIADAQPALAAALAQPGAKARLLIGQAGAGKTNTLAQCAQQAQDVGAEVFYCPADAVNEDDLEVLAQSLRFRRALSAIRSPGRILWLGIDGLDEVDTVLRERWAQHLGRLALGEKTVIVATVREATWHADPRLRHYLHGAERSPVCDWPAEQVRSLLDGHTTNIRLTPALFELLRQPLFLDLFWRTFVESGSASSNSTGQPLNTRHGLLTAFWQERVLNSNRQRVSDLTSRLDGVLQHAGNQIGGFSAAGLDQDVLTLLESESILVPEGSLNPRLRFRHPLLRDFAFALWCLRAPVSVQVAERWQTIRGGIQRQGALRAILEAMLDANAGVEFPHLNISELLGAFLRGDAQTANRLAQLLGTMPATATLNPYLWPSSACGTLPAAFGRELLVSARVANNGTWAEHLARWPAEAGWLDAEFATELYNYADCLHRIAQREPTNFVARRQAQHVARKLRGISEHPRFTEEFAKGDRWLKSMSLCVIAQLLPDHDTMSCWERELSASSWRTREFPLDHLIHIAGVDAERAAQIYRSTVGLIQTPAGPRLDPSKWQGFSMDHHAINWSLDGESQRRSLLTEHPKEFFSVALDLAVALLNSNDALGENIAEENVLQNDLPVFSNFWNRTYDDNFSDRSLRLIHKKAKLLLNEHPDVFCEVVCPLLASSRSVSIHSIYLDLISCAPDNPTCAAATRQYLFDARIYRARSLMHWLEKALVQYWSELSPDERSCVLDQIEAAADASVEDPVCDYRRAQLLANLPLRDLPLVHQRAVAASLIAQNHHPTEHPSMFFQEMSEAVFDNDEHDLDAERSEGWPVEFDHSALQALSRANRTLMDKDAKAEIVAQYLSPSIIAVQTLLPALEQTPDVLFDHKHFWAWYGLEASVNKSHFGKVPDLVAPDEFLLGCARLALKVLEIGPEPFHFEEPTDGLYRFSENAWVRALYLADAVLVWSSLLGNTEIQSRFEQVLRTAFSVQNASVHISVVGAVRPFHWARDEARRRLQNELIWSQSRHNQVLIMSLNRLNFEPDVRRSEILRLLLRHDAVEPNAKELADHVGHWVGGLAMRMEPTGGRTTTVTLLEETLSDQQRWLLLRSSETRRMFLRGVAFQMKEYAQHHWSQIELAADFASWNQSIWQLLRSSHSADDASDHIVLYALHWLEQNHQEPAPGTEKPPPPDPAKLRIWWEHLLPFWFLVMEQGHQSDVDTIFFALRPQLMNHIARSEEVFRMVDLLLNRLQIAIDEGQFKTKHFHVAQVAHRSWIDVLQHIVDALDALRQDGLLRTDQHRERAEQTLRRISEPPFKITDALRALSQLQADQT